MGYEFHNVHVALSIFKLKVKPLFNLSFLFLHDRRTLFIQYGQVPKSLLLSSGLQPPGCDLEKMIVFGQSEGGRTWPSEAQQP